jgi:hypothetical protein
MKFLLLEAHENDGVHWGVALDGSSNPEAKDYVEFRSKEDAIRLLNWKPADKTIVVTVEGGVIQNMSGIPEGVIVEVHDYDTDRESDKDFRTHDDGLIEGPEVRTDDGGNNYEVGAWGHVA